MSDVRIFFKVQQFDGGEWSTVDRFDNRESALIVRDSIRRSGSRARLVRCTRPTTARVLSIIGSLSLAVVLTIMVNTMPIFSEMRSEFNGGIAFLVMIIAFFITFVIHDSLGRTERSN